MIESAEIGNKPTLIANDRLSSADHSLDFLKTVFRRRLKNAVVMIALLIFCFLSVKQR